MATAAQVAKRIRQRQMDLIDEQLEEINTILRKYDPLFEERKRLESARRALLSERAPTAGGGRGLTQEEVVAALTKLQPATVHQVATELQASPGAVRAHFNRGDGERFSNVSDNGEVLWSVRNPEDDEEGDDEDE